MTELEGATKVVSFDLTGKIAVWVRVRVRASVRTELEGATKVVSLNLTCKIPVKVQAKQATCQSQASCFSVKAPSGQMSAKWRKMEGMMERESERGREGW